MWSIARRKVVLGVIALNGALAVGAARPVSAQAAPLVVRGLTFKGNNSIDKLILASVISTTNSSWVVRYPLFRELGIGDKRTFNRQTFKEDIYGLDVFYRASGFPDVKIDSSTVHDTESIWITIKITEGEPIRISGMTVDGGDEIADRFRVVRELPLAKGDIFNRYRYKATADTMQMRMRERGYPTAQVEASFAVDTASKQAKIAFKLVPGRPAVFGQISVSGFNHVDSAFIASLLTASAGKPYRAEELFRSKRALVTSQLFTYATVEFDSTSFVVSDSTIVPLAVTVEEGPMHSSQASVGYATNDCFRLGAGQSMRNFLGHGQLLDLTGQLWKIGVGEPFDFGSCPRLKDDSVGSRRANFSLEGSLRRNGFLSPNNTLTLSLFGQRRSEFKVYLREEVGASVAITRETYSRIPITLAYRLSYGSTTANDATFCGYFNSCTRADIDRLRQRQMLAMATLSASRLRVNNPLDPSRGTSYSAEISGASKFFGSSNSQQFFRIVADAAGYLPLTRSVVLAGHLKAGLIMAPKGGSGIDNFIPPEQRLYAGGPNDVRGYDRNELGPVVYVVPRDSVDFSGATPQFKSSLARVSATGGDRIVVANIELRTPSPIFPSFLRLATFVDAGALWGRNTTGSFRVTPGVGIRIVSEKLPPVRFDIAYNRYLMQAGNVYTTSASEGGDLELIRQGFVKPRLSKWTIQFSFGQAF